MAERQVTPMDWLREMTGTSLPERLAIVQQRIAAHTKPTDDPNHGLTDPLAWVVDVAHELMATWPEGWENFKAGDPRGFDENMRLACELGLVLSAWYASVHRAKSLDPRRPVALRRLAHARRMQWLQAMLMALVDDYHDPKVFPGQKWESPYLPDARDGKFI